MLYYLGLLSCQYFPKDNRLVRVPLQEFVVLLPSRIQQVTYFAIMDQGGTQPLSLSFRCSSLMSRGISVAWAQLINLLQKIGIALNDLGQDWEIIQKRMALIHDVI